MLRYINVNNKDQKSGKIQISNFYFSFFKIKLECWIFLEKEQRENKKKGVVYFVSGKF